MFREILSAISFTVAMFVLMILFINVGKYSMERCQSKGGTLRYCAGI